MCPAGAEGGFTGYIDSTLLFRVNEKKKIGPWTHTQLPKKF